MTASETKTALITGASSGIGAAFARRLASQGYDLVLVARREAQLTQLAAELHAQFNVNIGVLVADLSQVSGVESVEKRITELTNIDLLVNNAGFGVPGNFSEAPLEQTLAMIDVHILASTRLARAVLPGMIARDTGNIINVSSIGGFMPIPAIELIYSATKAYLIIFSEGLQAQLKLQGADICIQVLCPGFTHTGFHDNPAYQAQKIKTQIPAWLWMSAESVVEESIRSLKRGQVVCIPGFKNRVIVTLARSGLAAIGIKILLNSLRKQHRFLVPQHS